MNDEVNDAMAELADGLKDATRRLRLYEIERERQRKQRRFHPVTGKLVPTVSNNRIIREKALVCEPIGRGRAELWITYNPGREEFLRMRERCPDLVAVLSLCDPDALNGYVAFDKRHAPRLPMDTGNLVQYIPVHGGVTYAVKDSIAAVWGFDTMHGTSERVERTDREWMRYQCHILHHGLEIAADLWPKFRRERDQAKRAEMAQALFDIDLAASGDFNERLGFEALLNLFLGGRIG
jgi:hypothetical protein